MSWQIGALNVLLRTIAKPSLRRAQDPVQQARAFERTARLLFRKPKGLVHRRDGSGAVPLTWIKAGSVRADALIFYIHGGAYFVGSAGAYSGPLGYLSAFARVEVCAPDYRLLQQAPFPAAFDDCRSAWDAVLAQGYAPDRIVIGGDSAGGGLALALLADVLADGMRPAGFFAMSPWTDLTMSGPSIATLGPRDPIIPVERMAEAVGRYLQGADPTDPRASPLFASFAMPPPVLFHVGSEEALLDDTRRIASKLTAVRASVVVRVWDRAPHVFHLGIGWVPEARAALKEIAAFVQTSLESASR